MYYSLALFHAAIYSISQIYTVIISIVNEPCDIFPSSHVYAAQHLCIFASNCGLVLSLVSLCCERCLATACSRNFELFNSKVLSFTILPPGAIEQYNRIAEANIVIIIICIIILIISSRINKKRCSISTLTSRYQSRENVITAEFAAQIASLQATFFILQAAGGLLARIAGNHFNNNKKLEIAVRQMLYVIPVFTFLLPIYSIYRLKYYRLRREDNIRSIVTMECRGVGGTQNYENVITKLW
ncbi:hypothetical protein DICVIV_11528 [Dictyocaulus viviparus]|uniref:Uncharacterized protein n=1 Tax=Dictyocaulus viviparus TaxID=29172 RepID=A0A0D8XD04_DICVI|nr:hypothetical protein DICVIV_11528 [Dictyocaulus viviparus]